MRSTAFVVYDVIYDTFSDPDLLYGLAFSLYRATFELILLYIICFS